MDGDRMEIDGMDGVGSVIVRFCMYVLGSSR